MSDLFEAINSEESQQRSLPGAAVLKAYAMELASTIMTKIPEGDAEFVQRIKDSQTDHEAMDALVKDFVGDRLHNDTVAAFEPEEVKKLLKSNQSNRSRRKSMAMTQSNYVEMLTAAVAEWVLRESCGIQKSNNSPFGIVRTATVLDEAKLAELAEDQQELVRYIRNWSSKKSTYKSKHQDIPGWENDPAYITLCEQLEALRALKQPGVSISGATRRGTGHGALKGMSTKKALQYIFDNVPSTESLGKDDCYKLINECRDLAQGVYPEAFIAMLVAAKEEAANATEADSDSDTTDAPSEETQSDVEQIDVIE